MSKEKVGEGIQYPYPPPYQYVTEGAGHTRIRSKSRWNFYRYIKVGLLKIIKIYNLRDYSSMGSWLFTENEGKK